MNGPTEREIHLLRIIGFLRLGVEASMLYCNQLADALEANKLPPLPRRSSDEQIGVDLVQGGGE